ncbi:phosphate ABC transporter substrate-binding protein [Planctomycetales bacterium]|nr:phosphate ABC transporter substrate-binding protein [Planctomycetales bacterium]GHT37456.1 phosphate ABC transporter substrate-binding protein [Planctomycetales bacterium]
MIKKLFALCLFLVSSSLVEAQEIRIEGSTTVGPIVDAFVDAMKQMEPEARFTVKKTGSGDGAAALVGGRCEIAAMSRFMKKEEYEKAVAGGRMPVPFTICMDGVCFIVHPSNTVRNLNKTQITDIYTGKIKSWKELGGPDVPVVAISRDTSSGTYEVFHELAVGKVKLGTGVEYTNSNPQMFARINTTPGAIGYIGIGFLQEGVATVKFENVIPTKSTIASGEYPLSRPLYLFTDGYPKLGSPLMKFCNFFLTEEGQDIITAKGFVPLTQY